MAGYVDTDDLVHWVTKAKAGDDEAFTELYLQFRQLVYSVVYGVVHHRDIAEEITQDVFLQIHRKLSDLHEPVRFPAWSRTIAVRTALNVMRKEKIKTLNVASDYKNSDSRTPIDEILLLDERNRCRQVVDRLQDLDRRTLISFYFDGKSHKEMAKQEQCPIGTIKRRLNVARTRLKDLVRGSLG